MKVKVNFCVHKTVFKEHFLCGEYTSEILKDEISYSRFIV